MPRLSSVPAALAGAALVVGCAGRPSTPAEAPVTSAPLSSLATLHLIVFPVQNLRGGDSLGWAAAAGEARRYLATVDSALETAFRDRGLGGMWAMSGDLARTARRNPTYVPDLANIRAGDAARVMERRRDSQIPEPAASQIRTLAGFHDARYALVPVDLRFDRAGDGAQRAVLHVVVLDVRGSRLTFVGDISGDPAHSFSPQLATALAGRFADLVVER